MRVLHITPYFAPAFSFGGPPRSILALCRGQQAAGLDVEVVTTNANGRQVMPEAAEGTTYDGVPVRYLPVRGWAPLFWSPDIGRALRALAPGADVLHAHGLFNAPTWLAHVAARRSGRPLVVSVRGMLEPSARRHHHLRKQLAWSLFDQRVVQGAALLHTTSEDETSTVRQVTSRPIAEVPNAVDRSSPASAAARVALRGRLQLSAEVPIVLFLGRLHPIKRLDLLAAAFARVTTLHPLAHLVIAGAGDPRIRTDVDAILGEARKRTTWLGETDGAERDALLAESTVFVLCSDSENFGMGVVEALDAGAVPVVTRTCPWQLLESEKVGHWVPQTAEALAAGIAHVLTHPDDAHAMRDRGRVMAQRFRPELIGARWRDVYASVVDPTTAAVGGS